jgi:ADP-ribose pyrophosphatase YjhB (NUDIX family)
MRSVVGMTAPSFGPRTTLISRTPHSRRDVRRNPDRGLQARFSVTPTVPPDGSARGRRFARLAADRSSAEGYWPLPPDGLCLSTFLLLSPRGDSRKVLVGRIDPRGPWGEIGALDARRVRQNLDGWMLPSCHLMYFESPDEAATRILREQLGLGNVALERPLVFSETYRPRRHPERGTHWDLQFLYRGDVPNSWTPEHPAWGILRFVDPAEVPRKDFTRSHEEVLELAGYRIGA